MKLIRYVSLILLCSGMALTTMAGGIRQNNKSQDKIAQQAPVLQEILANSSEEASLIAEETHRAPEHIAASKPAKVETASRPLAEMSKSEQKAARKTFKKELKTMRKSAKRNAKPSGEYAEEIVCLIVAIFIPPLGVFLFEGLSTNFWIDLLLTILLFWIGGLIFALYIILR